MTPIEEVLWRAKPVDHIPHALLKAAQAELTQLRADLATAIHNHETVLKREEADKARLDWLDLNRWAGEHFGRYQFVRSCIDALQSPMQCADCKKTVTAQQASFQYGYAQCSDCARRDRHFDEECA